MKTGARPEMSYPPQLNPPPEPQPLLLVENDPLPTEAPIEANEEIFFFVSLLWHCGQSGLRSASEKRTIFSNSSPHSLQ